MYSIDSWHWLRHTPYTYIKINILFSSLVGCLRAENAQLRALLYTHAHKIPMPYLLFMSNTLLYIISSFGHNVRVHTFYVGVLLHKS